MFRSRQESCCYWCSSMKRRSTTRLCLSSQSYYFIRPWDTCVQSAPLSDWKITHRDCVYMVIGIQSARVTIRRINLITIIIILLSDKLAVLTNAPRGDTRGKSAKCQSLGVRAVLLRVIKLKRLCQS